MTPGALSPEESRRHRVAWLEQQVRTLVMLVEGAEVRSWRGLETAVRGGDGGIPPQFGGADVPCLVLWSLSAEFADGSGAEVFTYQDDSSFGLIARAARPQGSDHDSEGIYRVRALPELPTGPVTGVTVRMATDHHATDDREILAEVVLRVGGQELLLMAGEPAEGREGGLTWQRLDESVLAFPNPPLADHVPWSVPRDPSFFRTAHPSAAPPTKTS